MTCWGWPVRAGDVLLSEASDRKKPNPLGLPRNLARRVYACGTSPTADAPPTAVDANSGRACRSTAVQALTARCERKKQRDEMNEVGCRLWVGLQVNNAAVQASTARGDRKKQRDKMNEVGCRLRVDLQVNNLAVQASTA
eukprot:350667-Chlamydomonas_euryale.AAC.2